MTSENYKIVGATSEKISLEQEIKLILRWKKRKHRPSRDRIIANYILFTVKTARGIYPELPEDESLALAHDAILDAIERTDPVKRPGDRLSNLIRFSVRNCRRQQIRSNELVRGPYCERGKSRTVSIDTVGSLEPEQLLPEHYHIDCPTFDAKFGASFLEHLVGTEGAPSEALDREECFAKLHEILLSLTAVQQKILRGLFFEGKTLAGVGASLRPKITAEAVRQRRDRALTALREGLAAIGLSKGD